MPKGIYKHKSQQGFQKGHKQLNSGKTHFKKGCKGHKVNLGKFEEKCSAWKGNRVGYSALHSWVTKWKGTPDTCEKCGKTGLSGHQIHWANIDHQYRRVLDDYIHLCAKCHREFDKLIKKK